ncbi:MAG: prepilin-type N-terminal cleavage/methylation domain-containing protein [Proteobacteria bacterium]|nr:prepilin-type N-terminal cleavage/methylation domain-containing protein [Pseudomonadota bacterium]
MKFLRFPRRAVSRRTGAAPGFTLLEVMVSLAILAIIMTFVFTTYSASLATKDYVESRDELYHSVRTVFYRMTMELNSAYFTSPPRVRITPARERPWQTEKIDIALGRGIFYGEQTRENDRDLDRLLFFSLSHFLFLPLGIDQETERLESESAEIEYLGRVDYEKDITYLIRREDLLYHWPVPANQGASYAMLDNLRALNFRYYYQEQGIGKWLDEWKSTDRPKTPAGLPQAVEVTLTILDREKRELQFSTLVDIPRGFYRK